MLSCLFIAALWSPAGGRADSLVCYILFRAQRLIFMRWCLPFDYTFCVYILIADLNNYMEQTIPGLCPVLVTLILIKVNKYGPEHETTDIVAVCRKKTPISLGARSV